MKKSYAAILFIILLTGASVYYNYQEILFKRPQSVHKWRQSDCASIALNYYQGGMNPLKSETHNLTSDKGTSGKCCTSEIPVLYYSVACLYKAFGYHEYLYRIFNTLLFFLGLFFLFKLLFYLLKNVFWSVSLTLLFFTSPVLVYYGNNFLSNSSALAFSMVGWYFFIRFFFENRPKWFYISIAVFFLAAAFKVTALFSLFAIAGIYFIEFTRLIRLNENGKLFGKSIRYLFSFVSAFLIIGLWLVYAYQYNQKHDCTYFSTTLFPIWDLDKQAIKGVLENIRKIWLDQYFHISVLLFLTICFLFILYNFRKANKLLLYCTLFIFAEIAVYILLQFWTFADHDYYVIDMYILPVIIVIGAFDLMKRHYNRLFESRIVKVVFSVFLLFNVYFAHQKVNERYNGWMNDFTQNKDIYAITPYLRQIGISLNDTVISIPDNSNTSLYLMNQKGWTEYTDQRFNKGIPVKYNQDSAGIQHSVDKGAKYMIINGIKNLYSKPYLQGYCTHLAGSFNNVLIFNLKQKKRNFSLKNRPVEKTYRCNAETISSDKQLFISENDSVSFQNGWARCETFAHSGKYSSKNDAGSPYGMTLRIKDLKNGESFAISVWRKATGKSKGTIVASSGSPNSFYLNDVQIAKTDADGWEQISMEFFIPTELNNQELVIYAYNPDPEPVYFDDLEVIRYRSILTTSKQH